MDFMEKAAAVIAVKGKEAADKAKEMKEIITLKNRIATCEEVMNKNYMEIGRKYFAQYGEEPEEAFAKECRAIRNAEKGKEKLLEELESVKAGKRENG